MSYSLLSLITLLLWLHCAWAGELSAEQRAAHLFDRLSFGARPGEVEKLAKAGKKGAEKWIEDQLHPENIPNAALEKRLSKIQVVNLSSAELLAKFRKLDEVAKEMGYDKEALKDNEELKKQIREKIGHENLPEEIVQEMSFQRLLRAVLSHRQLEEMLADFWLNHFNIDISKGEEKWLFPSFERDVIRKRLFGKFGDLLRATAHHPAMLFYLDNRLSQVARANPQPGKAANGLNENYGRELLELHTLGVNGGYQQKDVTELARILTGWSISDAKTNPEFQFKEKFHDRGEKIFLGQRFEAGHGEDEGERALSILISHPSTAKFIAWKLCRFFISDNPPAHLVQQVAKRFSQTNGDLRETYRTIFGSREFWDHATYRAKIKTPFQFVASALRALDGDLEAGKETNKILASMGEELYRCAPPTGYPDVAVSWVNPGAMVNRLNFAVKLALNRLDQAFVQLPRLEKVPSAAEPLITLIARELLHDRLSANSYQVVLKEFQESDSGIVDGEVRPLSLAKATGLILGSPEFQRR